MQRVILQSVDIVDRGESGREAVVVLKCDDRLFTGRSLFSSIGDDLEAVARATLEAVRQCIPIPIELQLKKAARVEHDTITSGLFISVVELQREADKVSLTGSCLGQEGQSNICAAKATLDAVNRVTDAIIKGEYEGGGLS